MTLRNCCSTVGLRLSTKGGHDHPALRPATCTACAWHTGPGSGPQGLNSCPSRRRCRRGFTFCLTVGLGAAKRSRLEPRRRPALPAAVRRGAGWQGRCRAPRVRAPGRNRHPVPRAPPRSAPGLAGPACEPQAMHSRKGRLQMRRPAFFGPTIFSALSDSERSAARNIENLFQRAENWQFLSPQRLAAVLSP